MLGRHKIIRAAADAPHLKCGASEAEAKLLPRIGAESDSSHCTDAFRPVVFKLERIEEP